VRVNSSGGEVVVVAEQNLQEKGQRDYFQAAVRLKAGEVYYSDVNYNREHGEIALPLQIVLRVAVPVFSPTGELFGLW